MTWLRLVITDDTALSTVEKYDFPPLYRDFRNFRAYLAMLLANNGVRGVSRILLEFTEDILTIPLISSNASARLKILSNGYGKRITRMRFKF